MSAAHTAGGAVALQCLCGVLGCSLRRWDWCVVLMCSMCCELGFLRFVLAAAVPHLVLAGTVLYLVISLACVARNNPVVFTQSVLLHLRVWLNLVHIGWQRLFVS